MDEVHASIKAYEAPLERPAGDIELIPLKRLAKSLEDEQNLENKKLLINEIEAYLRGLNMSNYVNSWCRWKEIPLTFDDIFSENAFIFRIIWGLTHSVYTFYYVVDVIKMAKFEIELEEQIWNIDRNQLHEEILTYWAKWANLWIISQVVSKFQKYSRDVYIPDFERISTKIYEKWKNQEDIESDLLTFYEWINWRKVMIRSSAVYSEDNEKSTWAWIYDTIELEENASMEDFKRAVIKVFESVDNPKALEYRNLQGIKDEKMWLILQEYVHHIWNNDKWYVNTVLKWVPELIDISLDSWIRPIVTKVRVLDMLALWKRDSVFYYQLDSSRFDKISELVELSKLAFILEKYYWQAIQIEFILGTRWKICLLQTRFLPLNYSEKVSISFPSDKTPIFTWRSLWVFDEILDVLPNWKNNSDLNWVVVFDSSRFVSLWEKIKIKNLPKSWVIIILWSSYEDRWHIETLCAEKWLNLIFRNWFIWKNDTHKRVALHWMDKIGWKQIDNYEWHTRLHLVSDWLEWRIFSI